MNIFSEFSGTQILIVLLVVIGSLYYLSQGVMRTIRHRASEQTRREALAYVAEGSMTPDVAERLLKAGHADETETAPASCDNGTDAEEVMAEAAETSGETRRSLFGLVSQGKITSAQASQLLESICSERDIDPAEKGVGTRFCEAHTTYRELITRLESGKISFDDALQLSRAEQNSWKAAPAGVAAA